jgi:nucleotide-binding universal stress UspA family protein
MFSRLLIPLDGSSRAEAVLPAVAGFAKTLGVPVSLLHVIEKNAPEEVHDERHLRDRDEAARYLEGIKRVLQQQGIAVECHVHEDAVEKAADGIARHARELSADLIMMCTHGRGGIKRWLLGAVAQQVASAGETPVFLVPPDRDRASSFSCTSIVLPLDSKREHEAGVTVALFLAQKFHAAVHLACAVPRQHDISGKWTSVSRLLPGATQELLEQSVDQGEHYLKEMEKCFSERGIPVSSDLIRGDPKKTIKRAIKNLRPDLVVLGTHGRVGLGAFFEGSVAPEIGTACGVPVLLVPLKKDK